MKTNHLYRMRFTYPEGWSVSLAGQDSSESQLFLLAEGTCEGKLAGRLRASNHPRRRGDGTFEPNFQGIVETTDGAVVYHECRGYGRAHPGVGKSWSQAFISATTRDTNGSTTSSRSVLVKFERSGLTTQN